MQDIPPVVTARHDSVKQLTPRTKLHDLHHPGWPLCYQLYPPIKPRGAEFQLSAPGLAKIMSQVQQCAKSRVSGAEAIGYGPNVQIQSVHVRAAVCHCQGIAKSAADSRNVHCLFEPPRSTCQISTRILCEALHCSVYVMPPPPGGMLSFQISNELCEFHQMNIVAILVGPFQLRNVGVPPEMMQYLNLSLHILLVRLASARVEWTSRCNQ